MPTSAPRLHSYTVTLTSANQVYNLGTLISAIDSRYPREPRKEVNLQFDSSNTAGKILLVGDANLSTTRFGYKLIPGGSRFYPKAVYVPDVNLQSDLAGATVNVELVD